MSEQEYRKRRVKPSVLSLEQDIDLSVLADREQERKDRVMRQIMYSDEPVERLAVKAAAAGLVSFVNYEDLYYSSGYRHKKGLFGSSDEDWVTKRIKRLTIER